MSSQDEYCFVGPLIEARRSFLSMAYMYEGMMAIVTRGLASPVRIILAFKLLRLKELSSYHVCMP